MVTLQIHKFTNTQIQNIEYTNTQQSWRPASLQVGASKNELSPVVEWELHRKGFIFQAGLPSEKYGKFFANIRANYSCWAVDSNCSPLFPLRHISLGGKHVSSSGWWVPDGSVSYSSVLEAICSYCSRMSICNQCGNIFDFKGNLKKHMTTHSIWILKSLLLAFDLLVDVYLFAFQTT